MACKSNQSSFEYYQRLQEILDPEHLIYSKFLEYLIYVDFLIEQNYDVYRIQEIIKFPSCVLFFYISVFLFE